MSDTVIVFNEDNFDNEVIKSDIPVLVDFWAAWCVPCKMVAPTVEELSQDYAGRVKFGKVNVDENRPISSRFNIRGIPSLLIFKGGEVADTMVGVYSKQEIADMIDKVL